MSERITTEPGPAGVPLAVKRRPDSPAGLRHEAAVLERLRHPGVVELTGLTETDDGPVLRMVLAGPRTLADGALPLPVGPTVAALATTIADIHELGWVHGRIQPDHIVVGPEGRPVLCGLAGAAPAGESPPPWASLDPAWADPAHDIEAPVTPAIDVYGLGRVLAWLLDRPGADEADRRLGAIAAQATTAEPALRPSARALAGALRAVSPADDDSGHAPSDERRWAHAVSRVGMVAAGAVVIVALGLWVWPRSSPAPFAPPADMPREHATTTIAPPTTAPPTTSPPRRVWPGPPEAATSPVVSSNGVRFTVGQRGDRVAVADWDCNGTPTPVVLRPATGEVFVFEKWAAPGRDVTVRAATRVKGGRMPRADDPDGDGCPRLVIVDEHGARKPVTTAAGA